MFDKDIYIERRKELKGSLESGIILLLGNEESPMNYADNPFHFRQDSSFLYYFGLDSPGLAAIIDTQSGDEIIFGDELTVEMIVWMGTLPTLKERCARVGISKTQPANALALFLDQYRRENRTIHYLPPYRPENILKIFDLLNIDPRKVKENASLPLIKAIIKQRNYKTPAEIGEIEKAVNTTVDMHVAAMKMARPGITEGEIAAKVHQVALAAGGNIAFPIIATINGQTLHNHYHGNTLNEGDLFLLDAGAETAMHYGGDLSSTIPVSPRFTPRQKEIYQITLNAHQAAINALKPGRKFLDVHILACQTLAQGLKETGFMKGDIHEAVDQGAHALFFPCGTGHMMGLDIHDMEDLGEQYVGYGPDQQKSTVFGYKSLRLARELEPGFVLTIEPGVYFIPELIDLWKGEKKFTDFINYEKVETYKDFGGIRNEENFVITQENARLLEKPCPKTIEEVEAVRG